MSKAIAVMGQPGGGKTTSLRNLPPKETVYIDADGKGLSWKGWKTQYNIANKNYFKNDKPNEILEILRQISERQKHIKYVVVDTINGAMLADEMRRMKEKLYDKWADLAQSVYYIVHDSNSFRDDLTIILLAHIQTEDDGFVHILTNGKKLNKIQLESMLNTVVLSKKIDDKYVFEVQNNNNTVKCPMNVFNVETVDNDIMIIIKALEDF